MARQPKVWSEFGNKLSRGVQNNVCKGCGRYLPRGSWFVLWRVWVDGLQNKFRLCSDCERVVYGCNGREPLDCKDLYMVRALCSRCDRYPTCEMVDYLRIENPGKWHYGDLGREED